MLDSLNVWNAISNFKKQFPVRQEQTHERNLDFSQWIRDKCRPSKRNCIVCDKELGCFVAFDIDFVLYDYQRKMMQLLEVKTKDARVSYSQSQTFSVLDAALKQQTEFTYLGFHTLVMDGTDPSNSTQITWDDMPVTQEQVWRKINMIDEIEKDCQ